MADIILDNLAKRFGDLVAVNEIDLEVQEGEFLVLVGPSGCGKSTLLRTIAGLESPSDGGLRIGGRLVNDVAPKDREVAMVFQNYALYPHMSARRNMTFGMNSQGSYTDEEIDRRVSEAAEILGIGDLLDRKPAELSGGEKQRVAMGRALLRDPEVFLLDEPLSNLDAKLRDQMRGELTKLHDELQTTTVYVTHDQTEAMTLGDRVAVMNAGEIEQVDVPQRVYDYPKSLFVSEFIGSPRINIFDVEISRNGDDIVATNGVFSTVLPEKPILSDYIGEVMRLGIRPEDFVVADEIAETETSDPFDVSIHLKETLGDTFVLHGKAGDIDFRIQTGSRMQIDEGDIIQAAAKLDRLHLYNPETGKTVYHSDPTESADATFSKPSL